MQKYKKFKMMPIGPLMIEHRLIERMVELAKQELERIAEGSRVNADFIEVAMDFFRTYTDRCHHGKEENILFRDLAKKKISSEHKKILDELIEEHVFGRKTVGKLIDAKEKYINGEQDAVKEIIKHLKTLVEFYPVHIQKEDKHFFIPGMAYFTQEERDGMLDEGWEFDRNMIHEKYQNIVKQLENQYIGRTTD